MRLILISSLLLLTVQGIQAQGLLTDERWIDRKAEGYFWYKDQVEPEPEELKKEKLPEPVALTPAPTEPVGPAPLSSKWIRENMQNYLDNAIDNPTPENISAYLLIQKFAMDKSFAYMDATESATLGNPLLDEINKRPSANFAKKELDRTANKTRKEVLQKISHNAGLFVFMDGSPASTAQSTIIDMLKRNYTFDIISIATVPLAPDNTSQNVRPNKGHVEQLKVTSLPAIVMLRSDGVYDHISQAPVSFSDLQKRLLVGAKRLGVITKEEFDSTRSIRNIELYSPVNTLASSTASDQLPIPAKDIVNAFNGGLSK
ncbi:MAG: conjugal transfer protein TraF [Pseudomonadota bacterium]